MNWFGIFHKTLTKPSFSGDIGFMENTCNFTPRAQQVLALARKEAGRFNHNFVGTEHLLLGLIALGQGTAVNVLLKMGLSLESLRMEVEKLVGTGPGSIIPGIIPYTPRVKRVLSLAVREAQALHHTYVGTEHILLGLLGEDDGIAARVLKNLEVDCARTRQEVLKELSPDFQIPINVCTNPEGPLTVKQSIHQDNALDTSKRYDVYCWEQGQEMVIYSNVLFTGKKHLFPRYKYDILAEFIELEQADGQKVFIARSCVIKFCEHGAKQQV